MRPDRLPDPKMAMRGFAIQKVEQEAAAAIGPTLNMILKAEARTITAILNAKTPTQTKEVIAAAFRRAGLPSPFVEQPQSGPATSSRSDVTDAVMQNLETHTIRLSELNGKVDTLPTADNYAALTAHMQASQESYVQAVSALATCVGDLERRIHCWETYYLPHLLDRIPVPTTMTPTSPTLPATHHEEEMEPPAKKHMSEYSTPKQEEGTSTGSAVQTQPLIQQQTESSSGQVTAVMEPDQEARSSSPAPEGAQQHAPDHHPEQAQQPSEPRDATEPQVHACVQHGEEVGMEDDPELITTFRERSLRSCCAKVAGAPPRDGSKPQALKPFKAKA